MRKFALTGLLVSAIYVATTVAGAETVPQPGAPRTTKAVTGDVIVIGDCRLGVIQKVDVSSPRTGQLRWLSVLEVDLMGDGSYQYVAGTKESGAVPANRDILPVEIEILTGQDAPPGRKVFTEKNGLGDRRFYKRYYVQLMEGDNVEFNQQIGLLDDRLARAEYYSKSAKWDASQADVIAAEKTRDEAKQRWDTAKDLVAKRAISNEDYRAAEVTHERYKAEYTSKVKLVDVAREELNQARVLLQLHEIRSPIRGLVKALYKNPGEAVREQEPVLQIHSLDKLRIEGLVDAQYRGRIRKGMKAIVESPHRQSPRTLKGHLQEVTCVAVSNHKERPLIVSGSEDGTLRVWDPTASTPEVWKFQHPTRVGFRAVACSPKDAKSNLILAGSADGVVWVLDLDRKALVHKLENGHRGAVTMVSFTPDGSLAVTAGEDRPRGSICVWETATGKQRLSPPNLHGGAVTAVHFTATNHIVSVSRDNTLRVWAPGSDGKYTESLMLPRRSGDVPNLGVSPDGKHVLFDQGKELRLLSLPEGQYAGSISNPTGTTPFTTMALFSACGKMVLTAGAAEGRMQLWGMPGDGRRGPELMQLIPPERSQPTCGAFAPNGQFLVTGTRDRLVHVWNMPTKEEMEEQLVAEIMHVEAAIESGGRQMRVRADVVNKNNRLLLNDTVTLVVYPQ